MAGGSSVDSESAAAASAAAFGDGGGGGCVGASGYRQGVGGHGAIFPRWLLREAEFRQLAHVEPSAVEKRREEASAWIKKEVRRITIDIYLVSL